MSESVLLTQKHLLVCISEQLTDLDPNALRQLDYIKDHFCGAVCTKWKTLNKIQSEGTAYLCGDISQVYDSVKNKDKVIIRELSSNYKQEHSLIGIGEVPINMFNVGLYFRNFFGDKDYFTALGNEHQFQTLTESNKQGVANRKGIYLTDVTKADNDEIRFRLLRCSTNLDGPTDNFRATDNEIIDLELQVRIRSIQIVHQKGSCQTR